MDESNQISSENSEETTDYYSPLEEPSVYDRNNYTESSELSGLQESDHDDNEITQSTEQGTIVDDVLIDDVHVAAEITPQLHVRR